METKTTLAILGTNPRGVQGPVQGDRFDRLQGLIGRLEDAAPGSYWAGHAACHALMNGVPRVVVAGVKSLADEEELLRAVALLLARSPAMLVVPGLIEPSSCARLVEACAGAESPPLLWLDPPPGSDAEQAVAHARSLGLGMGRCRLITPWVPTTSPGRRSAELLPGSCLVPALDLGTAERLRGVHDCPAPPNPDQRAALEGSGCGLLESRGARSQVALAFPPALGSAGLPEPATLEGQIEALLEAACAPLVVGQRNGPALWQSLNREATAALRPLQRSGELVSFRVRCDAETNEGGGQSPVLEVWVEQPQRVRALVLRIGGF